MTIEPCNNGLLIDIEEVLLPRDHGLSHSGDIFVADVLSRINLYVINDLFPGVLAVMVLLSHFEICPLFLLVLLLSVLSFSGFGLVEVFEIGFGLGLAFSI